MNSDYSEATLNQIIEFFNGESAMSSLSGIGKEDIIDILRGHKFINMQQIDVEEDIDDILEYMTDDYDEDEMPHSAIMLFVKSDRFQLDLDDMRRIGEIAEEISDDIDLIWGICTQSLPRGKNMCVRIARFYEEEPDWYREDED